jgi:hypothetical protein
MPASDYEAEHGPIRLPKRENPGPPALPYHEVSGGAPGLGKRR